MFRVTIICDFQDPRARGKVTCASRCNQNPEGEGRKASDAAHSAKVEADRAGWKVKRLNAHSMGHCCPVCLDLREEDARA